MEINHILTIQIQWFLLTFAHRFKDLAGPEKEA